MISAEVRYHLDVAADTAKDRTDGRTRPIELPTCVDSDSIGMDEGGEEERMAQRRNRSQREATSKEIPTVRK